MDPAVVRRSGGVGAGSESDDELSLMHDIDDIFDDTVFKADQPPAAAPLPDAQPDADPMVLDVGGEEDASGADEAEPEGDDNNEDDAPVPPPTEKKRSSARGAKRVAINTLQTLFATPAAWRPLGLFACEGDLGQPYLLMESYFRGPSGGAAANETDKPHPRVVVARVSATSELAQLAMSPLYEFRMLLEPDPARDGFLRIAQLDHTSATFATAAIGSARTGYRQRASDAESMAAGDPYLGTDEEYRSIVERIGATSDRASRGMRTPLSIRMLETIFGRCFVAGPGRTRSWYWAPQSRPVQMHVVRQVSEDPLGLWTTHKALWSHMESARRTQYTERWVASHCAVFEGVQITGRWGLACERYATGRAFERFCNSLVLTRDPLEGTEFTALAMHEEFRKRQRSHLNVPAQPPSIFMSHLVVALERAYASGSGTSVLHVRPGVAPLLGRISPRRAADSGVPMCVVETLSEWDSFEALFDPQCAARSIAHECKRMFQLLRRVPRNWFETRQGVIGFTNPAGTPAPLERAFALEMARLSIDQRAETTMEHTLSTAHYVRLQSAASRLFGELTTWLYGAARTSPNNGTVTPSDVVQYLVDYKPRLYCPPPNAPAGFLVRVSSARAMQIEMALATRLANIADKERHSNEGIDVILMPLDARSGIAYDGVARLAGLIGKCTEADTIVVTPYALDRRARDIARIVIEQRNIRSHDHHATYTSIKGMLVSCGTFNLVNLGTGARNRHPITVIVDAAHLLSARQLLEIVDVFSGRNTFTRNLYIMGASKVLPHFDGKDHSEGRETHRGAPFVDLLLTLPFTSIQTGVSVDSHPASEADVNALTLRNDLETLQMAVTRWHLLSDRTQPVLQFSASRPSSTPTATYRANTKYYSLLASAQTFLPRTSDKRTLVRSHAMHTHYTGTTDNDAAIVYEMDWDAFSKMTLPEFLTVLSHGYRVVLYATPSAPTNFPWAPTANLELLASHLTTHFSRRLFRNTVAVARYTTWQTIGIHKLHAAHQQQQ